MKKICALIIVFAMLVSSMGAFATGEIVLTEPLGGVSPEGFRWRYNDESRTEIWIMGFDYDRSVPETLIIPSEMTRWSIILQKNVTAPVTRICEQAFENCDELKHVEMQNNVITIEYQAFAFCDNLETVEFSDSIETLGDLAFYKCYKLRNVILPSALKSIGKNAFGHCEGLDEIVIPPEVTTIDTNAFLHSNVSRFVIYDKVKKIGESSPELNVPYAVIDSSVFPDDEVPVVEMYGIPGSYIEEYANECFPHYVFKPISEYPGNLPNYANSATGNKEVCVKLNNEYLTFSQPPIIENGKTLVPLRAIFEALGAEVLWDGNTKTVTATKGETKISLQIGSTQMYVNGVAKTLKVAAKIVNSKTLVPARAVSEAFGCTVDWIDATKTVVITQTEK